MDGVVFNDGLDVVDSDCCPGHNCDDDDEDDVGKVLPLDFVVGVGDEPIGLVAKVEDACLAVDPCCSADDDADQDDEATPE